MEEDSILDQPIKANVRFAFASIPVASGLKVPLPPLWTCGKGTMEYFDEFGPRKQATVRVSDLDSCFFCVNYHLIDDDLNIEWRELPEGFYCNEFLDLNPLDIQEFLMFQREYGQVRGAREKKPFLSNEMEVLEPVPDSTVFAGRNARLYADQLEGIKASARLYYEVPDEEYVDERELLKLGAVTFREAIAAVLDAQSVIRKTTRVLRDDLPVMTVGEATDAKEASEYVAAFLPKAFPSIELVVAGERERKCDLITAVLCQLARGLLNNEAYRLCANPECGRLFTPRDVGRRLDTKYCSPGCQERAKRLRYVARHGT